MRIAAGLYFLGAVWQCQAAWVQDPGNELTPASRQMLEFALESWEKATGARFVFVLTRGTEGLLTPRAEELLGTEVGRATGGIFLYDVTRDRYAVITTPAARSLISMGELGDLFGAAGKTRNPETGLDVFLASLARDLGTRIMEARLRQQKEEADRPVAELRAQVEDWKLACFATGALAVVSLLWHLARFSGSGTNVDTSRNSRRRESSSRKGGEDRY